MSNVATNVHRPGRAGSQAPTGQLVALKYPNGRVYETSLDRKLAPGDEFEMYGRRWIALRTKPNARETMLHGPRTLCVPAASRSV